MADETVTTEWRSYEEVAQFLLNEMASRFGLGRVEGKQLVAGARTGTNWEIDAKGVREGDDGFLIIECRRYTTKGVTQEQMGALAYRVHDTGAAGAILVSPLDPQSGAQIVAQHEGIQHVQLSAESTTTAYVLRFLNEIFVVLPPAVVKMEGKLTAVLIRGQPADSEE
jgi:hypothetical protein